MIFDGSCSSRFCAQDIVKSLFADKEFNAQYRLGAVNSINWARILAQIVYYFSSYFAAVQAVSTKHPDTTSSPNLKLQYTVPTGNFGDILAGFYAKRMGLPVQPLVIATNANDILPRFFSTGRYEKADSSKESAEKETSQTEKAAGAADGAQSQSAEGGVKATLSPAMDILVSSNFERLLWYLALETLTSKAAIDEKRGDVDGGIRVKIEKAGETVKGWMEQLKSEGSFKVPTHTVQAAKREFVAERVGDDEVSSLRLPYRRRHTECSRDHLLQTKETIKRYYRSDNPFGKYVADPHTAVGLAAASRVSKEGITQIILSTAHPAKFASAVEESLSSYAGFDFNRDILPKEFEGLLEKERRVIDVEGSDPELTKKVVKEQVEKLFGAAPPKAKKEDAEVGASV